MKKWLGFAFTLIFLLAGLVLSQTRQVNAPVAPDALLYLVADTERELTRLPMAYTRISDGDEIKIGDKIAATEQSSLSEEDKLIERYVQSVGNRVAANAYRKLPYKFHYVPEKYFINAFALPGGHVFIGRGLVALMDNEDELAAVLGHEIEHVDHFHCVERLQLEAALKKIPLGELAAIPIELFQAGYSKDQEFEADREGTRLAVRAGYSADGAIEFFTKLQKIEDEFQTPTKAGNPAEEMSNAAAQVLTGYFQSHPNSSDRAEQIRALMAHEGWSVVAQKPLEMKYIFLGYKAQDEIAAAHYDKAAKAAAESLRLHPGYAPSLVALAKAKIATDDFPGAAAVYKDLVAGYPNEADEIRRFTGQLAASAVNSKKFSGAVRLANFSLELQPNNSNALLLLAQVDLELGDMKAAIETGQKLRKLYPGMGTALIQYANGEATQALQVRNYERAARYSSYSLQLEPLQPEAQEQLARSEFALAHFRAAADAYRKIISDAMRQKETLDPAMVRAYADSLGSLTTHKEAANEFELVFRPIADDRSDLGFQMKIERTGLWLMAGDESKARSVVSPATHAESYAPEHVARLGWWYYRAGRLDAAQELLRRFLLQRPGDAGLQHALAWVQLEKNDPSEALRLFATSDESNPERETSVAGETIARWRLRQAEPAMRGFEELARSDPEWMNPQWVKSLYGAVAAQSLQEMSAEQQRRVAARRGAARPAAHP